MQHKLNIKVPRFTYLTIWVALSMVLSCGKSDQLRKLIFRQIRQSHATSEHHNFIESHSFQSEKHPNIYFIFFDTLRPDLALEKADHIRGFFDRNFSFKHAYATGTATVYSMFSLFHSRPGFLTYSTISNTLSNSDEYGSVYVKVLKKLGYQMNSYGYYWGCVTNTEESGSSWERFKVSFFGWKTGLLERCQKDTQYDDRFEVNQDELTVAELEKKLPEVITSPENHFSLINFYNNHYPYRWGSASPIASDEVGDNLDFRNEIQTRNRYHNSILASNINFQRTMKLIESLPGYKDAIVVVYSDHGEMLYEKAHEHEHGGPPYKEKIRTLLSFQFTENSLHQKESLDDHFASIQDIFPTVMDYLRVSPAIPDQWVSGKSLLSHHRKSVLVVQASGDAPTRDMILENRRYKVWIRVRDTDFYHSTGFEIRGITDLNDKPILIDNPACYSGSEEECKNWLSSEFPEAIEELFPNTKETG